MSVAPFIIFDLVFGFGFIGICLILAYAILSEEE